MDLMCIYKHIIGVTKKEYVMVLNATSTIFQVYCGGQFYWWRKSEYLDQFINNVISSYSLT